MSKRIQVFEYQSIRLGEDLGGLRFNLSHLNALWYYHRRFSDKYFSLIHNGVKFSHYVGVIQVGNLTIEILPKTDNSKNNANTWQKVLLDMLKVCQLIYLETNQNAHLRLKSNSILDLYFEKFVSEVEQLLHKGLLKAYRKEEQNHPVCKGQLLLSKQLTHNYLHKEKMYTRQYRFDDNQLHNQILLATLNIVDQLIFNPNLQQRIQRLKIAFAKVNTIKIQAYHFQKIRQQKKVAYYNAALQIAELICLNYSPDIRAGQQHLLAIMFDMNLLFEEYIYQKLKRLQHKDLTVKRQVYQPFWQRRYIKPDIVLDYKGQRYVLDTKWKSLRKAQPSIEDLKQLFIYCQYFDAPKSLLIYPKVNNFENITAEPYHSYGNDKQTHYCQVHFAEIIHKGMLNHGIGQQILDSL